MAKGIRNTWSNNTCHMWGNSNIGRVVEPLPFSLSVKLCVRTLLLRVHILFVGAGDEIDAVSEADEIWSSFENCALSPQLFTSRRTLKPAVPPIQLSSVSASTQCTPLDKGHMNISVCSLSTIAATMKTTATSTFCVHQTALPSDMCTPNLHHSVAECPHQDGANTSTPQKCERHPLTSVSSDHHPSPCLTKKRVHFPKDSELTCVHRIVVWNFAYRQSRKGPWEQFARDRAHFRRRIDCLASLLEPCLAARWAATN